MRSPRDDRDPMQMSGGEVMRMLGPSFAASIVACVVGFILIANGHRALGIVALLLGAGVGAVVRLRLMMRGRRR